MLMPLGKGPNPARIATTLKGHGEKLHPGSVGDVQPRENWGHLQAVRAVEVHEFQQERLVSQELGQ